MSSAEALQKEFGIEKADTFGAANGGLVSVKLSLPKHNNAHFELYLHGAHVTSMVNEHGRDLLFMSSKSVFSPTSNLRGGIPIVFPQFGPNALPHTKALGQHGFARNSNDWKVVDVSAKDDEVSITLELKDNEATRKVWDHNFSFRLKNSLRFDSVHKIQFTQEMRVKNLNSVGGFYFTTALHTYFSVKDVTEVTLSPFKGVTLLDKIAGAILKVEENDAVAITGETDRVYSNTPEDFRILEGKSPSIAISKKGFRDVVIWNVWGEKAKNMADLGEGEWKKYVCAEVAQASSPMWLLPSQEWIASQTFGSHFPNEAKL